MRVLAGRYRLVRQVGRGGSAVVWQAVDQLLDRVVAIKLLAAGEPQDRRWREAVRDEARAAARVNHPNVAAVYDYGETRTSGLRRTPFLVLEYVDGETLGDLLHRTGALGWPEAGRICAEVAAGVTAVHEAGLVHRDVKPGNVLLAPDGPKLVDLGVALAVGTATVNSRGEIRGTPSYMAPEQLRGEPAGPACDVYALGLLLTQCLTGQRPARPAGTERDDHQALPRTDGVPEEIEELRRRCLAPASADRPTARTVARSLAAAAAATEPVRLRPTAVVHTEPRPTLGAPAPRGARVRRAALVGGLPVFLAGAVLAAQFPGSGSARDAQGAPDVRAAGFGCTVTYSSERTSGAFSAELSMEVTGTPPTGRSVLSFRLSPGQRLAAPLDRWQAGRLVRLPVPLRTSAPTRVPLQGTYTERAESGPDRFALAGVPCRRSSALVTVADDGAPATAGTVTDSPASGVGRSTTPRSADPPDGQRTAPRDGPPDEDRPPVPGGASSDAVASPSPATAAPGPTTDPTGSAGPQPTVSPTRSAGPAPSTPESPPATPTETADPVPTPSKSGEPVPAPSGSGEPSPVQPATPTPTGASRSTSPGLPV